MILNALNIKQQYYSEDEMDLYVRMAPGISREILHMIKKSNYFSNVYYTIVPKVKPKGRTLLKWIQYSRLYKKQYHRMLGNLAGKKEYDIALVAGFWNDSLYYIDFFAKHNRKLKIFLYDEGGATYDNPKRNLCRYYCNKNIVPQKERLKRFFVEKRLELKHKKRVRQEIYLYSPERYRKVDPKMSVVTIPRIIEGNEIVFKFFCEKLGDIYGEFLMPYEKKDVFFISSGNSKWVPNCESQSETVIRKTLEIFDRNKIVIKAHPNNSKNLKNFAQDFEKMVYVDRNNFLFEYIYPNVDIEKKLIITYASSSAMYAKTIFGKEPYIILFFRLFNEYHEHGDQNAERYAEDLIELYKDKTRIYIPNTYDELLENINEVKMRIIEYA